MKKLPRGRPLESRPCWWCRTMFETNALDLVYCCATCGRAARGCDAQGRPKRKVA